jgi:ATP-dependent DNA helicase RecG
MSYQFELELESKLRLLTADEIYTLKDPAWLKMIQEDRRVERKSVGIHARDLASWFSMWANTAPHGGLIAIGISNNGDLEGILSASPKHVNDLERTGDVYCPDARYEFKRVTVTNKDGRITCS